MPTPIQGRLNIAGKWLEHGPGSFESRNPANHHDVIGVFPKANEELAAEAVAAARAAYPAWRRMSRIHRADCFDRLAQIIQRRS